MTDEPVRTRSALAAGIRICMLGVIALVVVLNVIGMAWELLFEGRWPSLGDVWATLFFAVVLWAFLEDQRR